MKMQFMGTTGIGRERILRTAKCVAELKRAGFKLS